MRVTIDLDTTQESQTTLERLHTALSLLAGVSLYKHEGSAATATDSSPDTATDAEVKKPRKPRTPKVTTEGEVVKAASPAPAPEATPAEVVEAVSPAVDVFTEDDVATATRELAKTKGIDAGTTLLKEFSIDKARDLPAEQRNAYIARATELAK